MFSNYLKRFSSFFSNTKLRFVLDKKFVSNLKKLEAILGFKIYNYSIYLKALTHRSYLELNQELSKSNERLEFYGDSVLNMVVAKYLFKKFKKKDEGFLTKARASMVNRTRLYEAAEEIGLQDLILYNEKYLRGSKEGFQTVMADALEALIGAIDLDRGQKKSSEFVHKYMIEKYIDTEHFLTDTNYKGQLLELSHSLKMPMPIYVVIHEEGPHHNKNFLINAVIGDDVYGTGQGKNKKLAEQDAAQKALEKLRKVVG